jgi:PAS domain S-box-containing protein
MKILLVEDDPIGGQSLKHLLSSYSYAVDLAEDGEAGLDLADAFDYDLMVLDVILPGLDGLDLCQKLRQQGVQTPILLLTGQGGAAKQKAEALNAGADDYVAKPFDAEELIARVQALLRRGQVQGKPVLSWGKLSIDPSTRRGQYGAHQLTLTPKQYGLLEMFLRQPKQVFSSQAILNKVWDSAEAPGEEAVRVHIKELRRKLQEVGAPKDLIATVYRTGYRLNPIYSEAVADLPDEDISVAQVAELRAVNEELRRALERIQTTEIELRQRNETLAEAQRQLAEERQQIERLNQNLELQIAERTAALAEANRKLTFREQQWQALFDKAPDAILVADDEGRYLDANPAACQLFGTSKQELLQASIADFADPEVDVRQLWQEFLEADQMEGVFRVHRPDGTVREAEFSAIAHFVPGRHLSLLREKPGTPPSPELTSVITPITR